MRPMVLAAAIVLGAAAVPAEALTTRDIIELSRAGLGEEVLLALIEVDGSVFAIDPATIKSLKDAGVSENVIVALVRSGRQNHAVQTPEPAAMPAPAAPAPEPQVVIVDHHEPQPQPVVVQVPVYVPVVQHSRHRRAVERPAVESTFVPFQFGPPPFKPAVQQQPREPVYWGFGGKLRPDAWKPDGHVEHKSERRRK